MSEDTRELSGRTGCMILPIILVLLGTGGPAHADDGGWTFEFEALYLSVYGHDQHVLNIHEIDLGSTPEVDRTTAVNLETDGGFAPRIEVRYTRGPWRFGIDAVRFVTQQSVADQTAAASGSLNPIVFEIADRSFVSSNPGEGLFYGVLGDTELAVWMVDLYAMRTLAETPHSAVRLQFGLRNADFDNDYRAVVGIQDVGGRRLDASSNYGRMIGPLVGFVGEIRRGKNSFEGYLGQSVVLGEAELTNRSRDFTGPLSDAFPVDVDLPTTVSEESFRALQDVAIPITDLRLDWTYRFGKHFSLGAGIYGSVWWNVPVPPGVVPMEDGNQILHENTLVFLGLQAGVKVNL